MHSIYLGIIQDCSILCYFYFIFQQTDSATSYSNSVSMAQFQSTYSNNMLLLSLILGLVDL